MEIAKFLAKVTGFALLACIFLALAMPIAQAAVFENQSGFNFITKLEKDAFWSFEYLNPEYRDPIKVKAKSYWVFMITIDGKYYDSNKSEEEGYYEVEFVVHPGQKVILEKLATDYAAVNLTFSSSRPIDYMATHKILAYSNSVFVIFIEFIVFLILALLYWVKVYSL